MSKPYLQNIVDDIPSENLLLQRQGLVLLDYKRIKPLIWWE